MLGCQSWGPGFDSPWFHFHFLSFLFDSDVSIKPSLIGLYGERPLKLSLKRIVRNHPDQLQYLSVLKNKIPQKVKNDPKIKSKSNIRIHGYIVNESCSTTWVDLKTVVEPYSDHKTSPLGPQKDKNDSRLRFFLLFSLFTYHIIMVGGGGYLKWWWWMI